MTHWSTRLARGAFLILANESLYTNKAPADFGVFGVNGAFARVADNFDFQVVYGRCDCDVDVFDVETSKYEGTKVGVFRARLCTN